MAGALFSKVFINCAATFGAVFAEGEEKNLMPLCCGIAVFLAKPNKHSATILLVLCLLILFFLSNLF
jgi:hypothetical protein